MDETKNLAKTYNPKEFEERLYDKWMEKGYFTPEVDKDKEPYTIVIPPPNITGQLHMGHALDNTIQDVLIRWKRMQGYSTLWVPGEDHASIATEVKVEEELKKQGIIKKEIGRDEFLDKVWDWTHKYRARIREQLQKLGSSCDWSRERFTMDAGLNEAVKKVFIDLYEKGLIYRGSRIINWCPRCKTALSDAEVEYTEQQGHFWHIMYPVKGGAEYVVVATTRPETMLGDTAVAVHPEDERYKHLIGKMLILPIMNREIPVIADSYVDKDFGTGCVKITPAHDPNDFEVGQRHNLEQIRVMNDDGTMNEKAGKYDGLDRYEARKQIVEDLTSLGLLVKTEEHDHNVGECYRCSTTVEPILSKQWFVNMKPLAEPAIEAVKNGSIEFVPDRFSKVYFNWMENIQDWCISRQLWWGHRIPVWYCKDCGEIIVAKDIPQNCGKCQSTNLMQDEDVLDTWFSSALWPFSTLGWPENTEDLKYFYPTSVLVTGYDIIFFWVARMIFSGLESMKEIPFNHVFIHGIVRDSEGRKMSKSLGNGIDPLEIIDRYGADALRFMLMTGNTPGNDMRFYMERVEASRNFANKIWNASRFVMMNLDEDKYKFEDVKENLSIEDKWILSRFNKVTSEVTENLDRFELGIAAQKIYDFSWNEYCDWYIELIKTRLYGENNDSRKAAIYTVSFVLEGMLKLLHPFMPFITEEIFTHLKGDDSSIVISEWPKNDEVFKDEDAEEKLNLIIEAITSIRNVRAQMNVPPSKKARVMLVASNQKAQSAIEVGRVFFERLASAGAVDIMKDKKDIPDDAVSAITHGVEIYMPLEDLVDKQKEIDRLTKEKEKLEGEIARVESKLSNEKFISKAPLNLVDEERAKGVKYKEMLSKVIERLESLKK
ncbi:valine--tRNA ligase [Oxobacter pfennigii]|uniref:Valine--tRNA ligase n=1 Tax=Oxobacter pfennigii TaxID=36849 RepID=A0A0P8W3R0_9CLOT|nr:valine--tRNA ligase [Oxobacter pfennigii]KPU42225.1 valine--tRNA ligase [Oxobacter pfennigii]